VPKGQIIAEPAGRNTAPAIGLAAKILHDQDPDAVMGVFSADHYFEKPAAFLRLVRAAYKSAGQGQMAILGITPKWPETGYGYIEFPRGGAPAGAGTPLPVVRFREKPDLATATRFVKAGHFAWNSGIFFWRADVLLAALHRYLPVTAELLASLPAFGARGFAKALAEVFPRCENVSIDYAVMEKASGVVGFAAGDVGWNDVGSWNAVYEMLPKDAEGNVARTSLLAQEAKGNFVDAPGKLVALVGVDDLVVVDTGDALLVCRRDAAQKVSALVKRLEQNGRADLL
jgi:mannose-1-phosphate guanylyltransferase